MLILSFPIKIQINMHLAQTKWLITVHYNVYIGSVDVFPEDQTHDLSHCSIKAMLYHLSFKNTTACKWIEEISMMCLYFQTFPNWLIIINLVLVLQTDGTAWEEELNGRLVSSRHSCNPNPRATADALNMRWQAWNTRPVLGFAGDSSVMLLWDRGALNPSPLWHEQVNMNVAMAMRIRISACRTDTPRRTSARRQHSNMHIAHTKKTVCDNWMMKQCRVM